MLSGGYDLWKPFAAVALLIVLLMGGIDLGKRLFGSDPAPTLVGERIVVEGPPASPALLAGVTSGLVGRPVTVRCVGSSPQGGEMGFVHFREVYVRDATSGRVVKLNGAGGPSNWTQVVTEVCADLGHLTRGLPEEEVECLLARQDVCGGTVHQVITALHILAHEAHHLRGVMDEATTDCYARQTVAQTATLFGASPDLAHAISDYAWRYHLPTTPPSYQSGECRDGGRLDLRPQSRLWPS